MSAVAVQQAPLLPAFRQPSRPRPSATPAKTTRATPGIITLSKPLAASPRLSQSVRARKPVPATTPSRAADVFQHNSAPRPEPRSAKKPRSRPTSDEEHETPSKPRGRRSHPEARASPVTPSASPAVAAPKSRRNHSRTRQTPSPTESDPAPPSTPTPALQKPSGRLAKQRRGGFTKSTPALCTAAASTPSVPVPVPQLSSTAPHPSGLSRSAPLATPAMSQTIPARMRRTLTASGPPQVGREDPATKDVPLSPSPPSRVRETSWKAQGPLTAPLNGGAGFPSRPAHARSPSEALFNLSLDETDDEPQDIPILFGRSTRGGDKVYAGGKFQNGPDPTLLPAPSFLSGF